MITVHDPACAHCSAYIARTIRLLYGSYDALANQTHMRARDVLDGVARACDRYIEWCDYLSDRRWHRWGRILAPIMRACEWIKKCIHEGGPRTYCAIWAAWQGFKRGTYGPNTEHDRIAAALADATDEWINWR